MNVLITGGASGLGRAITECFAQNPKNQVFFTYNSSVSAAENLMNSYKNVSGVKCSFSIEKEIDGLVGRIPQMEIDLLVNNALSNFIEKHFHKMKDEDFAQGFHLNVLPTIKITKTAIQHFRQKKYGRIINILTSYLINRPPIGLSEYVAEKAFLESLSKSWAVENAAFNITSNCISPSMMRTNLTAEVDERFLEQIISSHPLKRLLTVSEVAEVVLFLGSTTPHINGINLVLNGGANVI